MGRVATAFTGEALFVGGLDISPTFAAERPQASTVASIGPTTPDAGPRTGAYLRSSRSFEAISSADVGEAVDEKPVNPFCSGKAPSPDGLLGRHDALIWLGNAHEFRCATTGAPMGYFTTSRRKLRKHFS